MSALERLGGAARAHGLDLLQPPAEPHVRCARGSRLERPRTVVHRRGRPAGERVVDVLTTVLDCARCLDLPDAVAVCDSALRRGLLTAEDLSAAVGHLGRGDPRARLAAHADARSDSLLESVVRVELRLRGLPVRVQVAHEGVGRVDLLVGGWLVVELDGFAFHADRAGFREDRRRDVELARRGRVVLRFTYEDVLRRRERLVDAVVDVLAAGRPLSAQPSPRPTTRGTLSMRRVAPTRAATASRASPRWCSGTSARSCGSTRAR